MTGLTLKYRTTDTPRVQVFGTIPSHRDPSYS